MLAEVLFKRGIDDKGAFSKVSQDNKRKKCGK